MFRYILILFLLSLFSCKPNHSKEIAEIDRLLKKADSAKKSYQYVKALEYSKKAFNLAKSIDNKEKIAKAAQRTANMALDLDLAKEALPYIQIAEEGCPADDYSLKKDVLITKSAYFSNSGFYDKAIECNYAGLKLLNSKAITDNDERNKGLYYLYSFLYYNYLKKGQMDSATFYQNKMNTTFPTLNLDKILPDMVSYHYYIQADELSNAGKIDSAFAIVNHAYAIKIKNNDPIVFWEYISFGNYYLRKNEYEKTLKYWSDALKNLEQHKIWKIEFIPMYESIAGIQGDLGNHKQENEFLKLAIEKKKEAEKIQKENRDYAINFILKDEAKKQKKSYTKIIIVISAVAMLIIFALFIIYRRTRKKTEEITINLQQEKETVEVLNKKVNESFDEVVQLAKENNPEFLTRFQEIYPDFIEKLKEIYPEISSDDLRFCALLKLNFSTKDIAEYTFVTVRTVQTRKSRLRKKFNIPSDEDIYLWMNELG